MPFTPFHLGPALLLGLACYRWFDLPSVLAASVAVDVRAALVLFDYLGPPIHGPLHTLLGSAAIGLLVAGTWSLVRPHLAPILATLGLPRDRSTAALVAGAVASAWLHVGLDALLYPDVAPFAPLSGANPLLWPLYGPATYLLVYGGCVVAGLVGATVYLASVWYPDSVVALDALADGATGD